MIKAEVRITRNPNDEYDSYLVFIDNEKSLPYLHIPETFPEKTLYEVVELINKAGRDET